MGTPTEQAAEQAAKQAAAEQKLKEELAARQAAEQKAAADKKAAAKSSLQFEMGPPRPTPGPRMKQAAESDKTNEAANKNIDQKKPEDEVSVEGKISWEQLLIEIKKLGKLFKPAMKELKERYDKWVKGRDEAKQSGIKDLDDLFEARQGKNGKDTQEAAQITPENGNPTLQAGFQDVAASYDSAARNSPPGGGGPPVLTAQAENAASQPSLTASAPPPAATPVVPPKVTAGEGATPKKPGMSRS